MLEMGSKAKVSWGAKKLQKLQNSFTDVNYHSESQGLGIAIDYIEDGDKKGAVYYMDMFNDACTEALDESVNEGNFKKGDKVRVKASSMSKFKTDRRGFNNTSNPIFTVVSGPKSGYISARRAGKLIDLPVEGVELLSVNEAIDVKYWSGYHEDADKFENWQKDVAPAAVRDRIVNFNNETEFDKVNNAGEKKVKKLADEFFKAAGWISDDIIDAMISQES